MIRRTILVLLHVGIVGSDAIAFNAPLFSDGMLLQRGEGTKVWGGGATPSSSVTISIASETCVPCPTPAPAPPPKDVLECFNKTSGGTGPSYCNGKYPLKFPAAMDPTECAGLCLNDTQCVQFVWGHAAPACRLSYECSSPYDTSSTWDGYLRKQNISGCKATPSSSKTCCTVGTIFSSASGQADANGSWIIPLPKLEATKGDQSTMIQLTVSDGKNNATISKVAVGDLLLCGGQSNMGFGMCGARSKTQTAQQALDDLPPLHVYFQAGSGPNGGAGVHCKTSSGESSNTPAQRWFTSSATNAGGASAVCMLTAQRVFEAMDGQVPVGVVESCISGTNVEPWTPPSGSLWKQHMVPLLPMTFRLALWDQGEADAKRTNSTWYAEEFPRMILGWREAFESTGLPFFYVELCTELGAEEPKESDFWVSQRSATKLPSVGYAVTTDVERALHPPDKQDIADRLALEIRRMVYAEDVVSRGPELVSAVAQGGSIVFTFSNSSLSSHAGIYVGDNASCAGHIGHDSVATDAVGHVALNYSIDGATVTVKCQSPTGRARINADYSTCFLYGPTGLPAPSVEFPCSSSHGGLTVV